jgi:hypothetical protein
VDLRGVPASRHGEAPRAEDADALWAFLPILVSLAAICLLTFLFLTPSFESGGPTGATSAHPETATSVTVSTVKPE